MNKPSDITLKIYLIYLCACLTAVAILVKVFQIQVLEGEYWGGRSSDLTTDLKSIEAVRGNIYSEDGSLMATSIPYYEIRMDMRADGLKETVFFEGLDSLAIHLSSLFRDKSPNDYRRRLLEARKRGERYFLVQRNVDYHQLQAVKKFPIFRRGRYKGGVIYERQNKRKRPFQLLAARTIGYERQGVQPVGLEGAYSKELKGTSGKRFEQKIAGGVWMPIRDGNEVEPEDGYDLHTTIDINLQGVAEHALLKQLQKHNADHGCVVLMEVQTGFVKAIANLTRQESGRYYESYNYAVGESTEPGSTFKLPVLMAALEEGKIDVGDSVDTEDGTYRFYDQVMTDANDEGYGVVTIQRAFEVSSNVGISRVINQSFAKEPEKLVHRLHQMNLSAPLGLEIAGEGKPKVKNPLDKDWSGVSIPWMSIGYEVLQTPLQTLAFYNAVANDGVMVKPLFVREISKDNELKQKFEPVVVNPSICSKSTIAKAKTLLEGVVQSGTAKNLRNSDFKIAGKTGTAQIANEKYGYKYEAKVSYQASFVGYFPADQPKYSCIVVVNAPSSDVYYGNLVAGPIFKEIADKVYANSVEIHREIVPDQQIIAANVPYSKNGHLKDLESVFKVLEVPVKVKAPEEEWAVTMKKENHVLLDARKVAQNKVPNVVGMGLSDALFLLENMGLKVNVSGRGVVVKQSLPPGTTAESKKAIVLELSS